MEVGWGRGMLKINVLPLKAVQIYVSDNSIYFIYYIF
jgi:hypothetical protein